MTRAATARTTTQQLTASEKFTASDLYKNGRKVRRTLERGLWVDVSFHDRPWIQMVPHDVVPSLMASNAELTASNGELATRNAELESAVAERDAVNAELTSAVAERDAVIAELKAALATGAEGYAVR